MVADIVAVAREEFPRNEQLKLAQSGELREPPSPQIGQEVPWQGPEDIDPLEKIIGDQTTLVHVSYLEVGLLRSQAVGRVVRSDGTRGSGFLVGDNLLITNNHVLKDAVSAKNALVQFNFQQADDGSDAPYEEFRFVPEDGFATSVENDWTAVRVCGDPVVRWKPLALRRSDVSVGDRVNIIQHPGGGPKQLAFFHNVVAYADYSRIQYLTDTLPGSSGSPVFDKDWQLVAVHHSGGLIPEPSTKRSYYRNEGIHINVILDGLQLANLLPAGTAA
jgi:V8-like Glu-specific endopeptidase